MQHCMLGIQINFKWNVNLERLAFGNYYPYVKKILLFSHTLPVHFVPLLVSIVWHKQNGCFDGNKTGIDSDNWVWFVSEDI